MHFAIANLSETLRKFYLQKPNCETLQNIDTPLPFPRLRQDPQHPCLLSMVILNVFRLFIIKIPKTIVSAVFLT